MQLRKMSPKGDEVVAEYDETTTADRMAEIETEFKAMCAKGYFAADITPGKEAEIIQRFDPKADILMLPAMQGGAR